MSENDKEEYGAYTDDTTLWVNSGEKCVVRICGLDNLKGMASVKAMVSMSLSEMMNVSIVGGKPGDDDDERN
jgi:hypothetical protein